MNFRRRVLVWVLPLLSWLFAVGCGQSGTDQKTLPSETAVVRNVEIAAEQNAPADGPASALTTQLHALATGDEAALIETLPGSYLKDIDEILQESVKSLKPDVRRELAGAIARFSNAVGAKRTFVLESNRIDFSGLAADWIRTHLEIASQFVTQLATEVDWGDDRVLNAQSLMKVCINAIGSNPEAVQQFKEIDILTKSQSGDAAIVTLRFGDGEESDLKLVRIEERWVPEALAARWDSVIGGIAGEQSSDASGIRDLTRQLTEVTATLEAVQTQAEFDAAADRAANVLLATFAQTELATRKIGPTEYVTVVIESELSEQQKDEILWLLAMGTDLPPSAQATSTDRDDGTGMVATVGPVADLGDFSQRLESLNVTKIDEENRTITARLKTP